MRGSGEKDPVERRRRKSGWIPAEVARGAVFLISVSFVLPAVLFAQLTAVLGGPTGLA